MVRVGLLGLGDAGKHHARALKHGVVDASWTTLGARDADQANRVLVDELGVSDMRQHVVAPDELLAGGRCDALIIATPDGLHFDHARRALAAGMHVLVEKPLALEVAQAHELVALAQARDRVLQVGYQLRHHVGHERVHAQLAELVGTLRTIHVRWAWPDPAVDGWRARGHDARWWSLAALGTHAIDLALWLDGGEVVEVHALREPPAGIDRLAEVSLRFASGVLAHVSVAVTHRAQPSLVLAGDAGEVDCAGTLGARGAGTITHRANREATELGFAVEDPYLRQLRTFVARCEGSGARIDAQAATNVELLHRISPA